MSVPGICKTCGTIVGPRQRYCDAHRPNKYHANKVTVAGLQFDSAAEGERYLQLVAREQRGEIEGWDYARDLATPLAQARQQRIPLVVNGHKVATYVADFVYRDVGTGQLVVEDFKGFKTDAYRLKAKLFAACLGFPITEITRTRKKRSA